MGTGPGNRLGRTGARRVATAGTADTPPEGQGAEALANWINQSGYDLDNAVVDQAVEIAFNEGAIGNTSRDMASDWALMQTRDQNMYERIALTSGGQTQGAIDVLGRTGLDAQTERLARTALTPVANRERFYWQTAYTNAQVAPQPLAARRALAGLRRAERDETDAVNKRRIGGIANRISRVYGLEGNAGASGFARGGRGDGGTDMVTNPRLMKWNPDTIQS